MFDPLYLGCDLYGSPVRMMLAYRNLNVRMWFFDGKWVELGFWQPLAERFIGRCSTLGSRSCRRRLGPWT
jgi:hypothetical protein